MERTIERLRKECERLIEDVGKDKLINRVREAEGFYKTSNGYFEFRNVLRGKGSVDATLKLINVLKKVQLAGIENGPVA